MHSNMEVRELSNQELDMVEGGFIPFLVAAAIVVAADVGLFTWGVTHQGGSNDKKS